MAVIVAYIDIEGQIKQWISPELDEAYVEGEMLDGYLVKFLPKDTDMVNFAEKYVYLDGSWVERPKKPGHYYVWQDREWKFLADRFEYQVRTERNKLLLASDWTQLPDAPLTEEKKQEWNMYRQELRDFMEVFEGTDMEQIVWPLPPA